MLAMMAKKKISPNLDENLVKIKPSKVLVTATMIVVAVA
jgi:hypothetical protein